MDVKKFEYNVNNMPTGIERDKTYLIKILKIAEESIDDGNYYDCVALGFDRTKFVWHVRWLMVRGYIRENEVEVDPIDAQRNMKFYERAYIVTPITSEGLKFLKDLQKSSFRKFLDGSEDSTAYLLVKRCAEFIGYLTVFGVIVKGLSKLFGLL